MEIETEKLNEEIGKFAHEMFMCNACVHKNVCKLKGSAEKCDDYLCVKNPKEYSHIYEMFEPIFGWLKTHYPAGGVRFVVDSNSAIMIQEHGVSVFSKEIREGFATKRKEGAQNGQSG